MAAADRTALPGSPPRLSVVIPVRDEVLNVPPLIDEVRATLDDRDDYEIVVVDDFSADGTFEVLSRLADRRAGLRVVRHRAPRGQTTAILSGVRAAAGEVVVTLDGDGQNDPADLPLLLDAWARESAARPGALMVIGTRVNRRDAFVRRASSRVANGVRGRLLGDRTPDTGCGIKVFARQSLIEMPHFDHMHRFLPALMIRAGGRVVSLPVNHRPRRSGRSKYGTLDRLFVGIVDLFGVLWLMRRRVR